MPTWDSASYAEYFVPRFWTSAVDLQRVGCVRAAGLACWACLKRSLQRRFRVSVVVCVRAEMAYAFFGPLMNETSVDNERDTAKPSLLIHPPRPVFPLPVLRVRCPERRGPCRSSKMHLGVGGLLYYR